MNVHLDVTPGRLRYNFFDVTEEEIKLMRKALLTNYEYNNFHTDEEEGLCKKLVSKFQRVIGD